MYKVYVVACILYNEIQGCLISANLEYVMQCQLVLTKSSLTLVHTALHPKPDSIVMSLPVIVLDPGFSKFTNIWPVTYFAPKIPCNY